MSDSEVTEKDETSESNSSSSESEKRKPSKEKIIKKKSEDESSDESSDDSSEKDDKMFETKVKTYVKLTDQVKIKREEIKDLNDKIKPVEQWLIKYMDKEDLECIEITGGKLVKNETEVKGPLKVNIIEESILEKIKKDKIFDTEDKCSQATEDIIKIMEDKREKSVRTNIKKVSKKEPKKTLKKKR